MKYNKILFDLDGTLTESAEGITKSVAYACEKMGFKVPPQHILDKFVGPPLIATFMEYVGMTEEDAVHAVESTVNASPPSAGRRTGCIRALRRF